MAANREAKVRFTAETQEFSASLKDAKNEIKTLNSELKLNAAEMRNSGESVDLLKERQELLAQKLQANAQEQEALSGKIETATEIYGADSEEVAKLERQLIGAQTAQQNIEAEIDSVNGRIEEQAAAAEANESALGRLNSTIDEQKAQLQELQTEYVNTALERGTDSEEAERLAEQIKTLSTELQGNQQVLEEVTTALQNLASGMDEAGGEAGETAGALGEVAGLAGQAGGEVVGMLSNVAGAIAAGGVAGGIMAIASALIEVGKEVVETAMEFEEGTAIIVEGTGLIGEELDKAKESAEAAFAAIADADASVEDAYGTAAELITRLGMKEGSAELEATTTDMLNFAKVTGEDAVNSVDMFSDALMNWNMEATDLPGLMNEVTAANQNCDAGVSSLMNSLTTYAVTWQDLGFSTGEALGQLVAWEQAGLNSDQVIRGLDKACKELAKTNTDDIPGAIQSAMTAVSEAENRYEGLNIEVGNTGKTINDLFGSRMAGTFVQAMQSNRVATEQWTTAVKNSGGVLAMTASEATTFKDSAAQSANQAKQDFKNLFQQVADGYTAYGRSLMEAQGYNQNAKKSADDYSSALEDLYGKSKKAGDSVKEGMAQANKEVQTGVTTMQTTMNNMQWKVPRPQIPVFSMTGSFDAKTGSVPTIGVTWHAKGGIFSQPTLLTGNNGLLHGIGEAGPEAIAPIDTLQEYIVDAIGSVVPQIDYDLLSDKLGAAVAHEVAKMNIEMEIDGREFGRIVREAV